MKLLIQSIIEQLEAIQHGKNWVGTNFARRLETITEKNAFVRPLPNLHSVAEIIAHLNIFNSKFFPFGYPFIVGFLSICYFVAHKTAKMSKDSMIFCSLIFLLLSVEVAQAQIFKSTTGTVNFSSDAPLELIEAQSDRIQGVIDATEHTFAFKINMKSFTGFNSALQQTHFNENYLETNTFPTASFTGKIIEQIDFTEDGIHQVRAKGKLEIHGISRERIIKSTVRVTAGKLTVQSNFTILLAEHDIRVPKIVNQKIAEEIAVTVDTILEQIDL